MKCFLSRSFRPEDRQVGLWVRNLLEAFLDIEILEAGHDSVPIDRQVDALIDRCDFVCAVVTSRDGAVPQWVCDEISRALTEGKRVIAFVEDGISDLGSLRDRLVYKTFTRRKLCESLAEYVRYVQTLRRCVYNQLGQTRPDLLRRIKELKQELAEAHAQNKRLQAEIDFRSDDRPPNEEF